jgi:O-antigen/teichoic acid export membrane protein
MQKTFIKNLALLLALNLLIKPFWVFGIEREVQEVVKTENYGLYFALFNFSFLLNILLDFGITNFNNKNIAQNNHLITKHFSSILVLKLMLGVAFMVVTLLAGMLQFASLHGLVAVAVVFGLGQLLESFVLTPRLVGERIGLSPLAVIFALLAFGHLFGFVGVLVALPLSAVALVALNRLRSAYLNSRRFSG